MRIVLALSAVIGLLLVGFYFYYTSTQRTITTLKTNNALLESGIEAQKDTINILQESFAKQTSALEQLRNNSSAAVAEKTAATNRLLRENWETESLKNPALVESRINHDTKELFNSFTTISTP